MKIVQIGNASVAHCTEVEFRKAFEALGHEVLFFQESEVANWRLLAESFDFASVDLVAWTKTNWPWREYGITEQEAHALQRAMLERARVAGVSTISLHLDRWWDLNREHEIHSAPFFRTDFVFTADGGHQEEFAAAGVNHHWLPPGASEFEAEPGTPRPEYASDLGFIGSWESGYHAEWQHRPQLVRHLQTRWARQCRFWPPAGQPAIRQDALRDLVASVDLWVGDSCLVPKADGTPITRYYSDRTPELLIRGAALLHPYVEDMDERYIDGKHIRYFQIGDFDELDKLIDYYLTHDTERQAMAAAGRQHVLDHETYTVRLREVLKRVFA